VQALSFAIPFASGGVVNLRDERQLREDLKTLFASQSLGVLATQREEGSYTSLVAFLASRDLKRLFFVTNRATRKYANLSANSRVAMLVDNRSNRVSDFRKAMAVTATGTAEEVQGRARERALRDYLIKHPYLKEFATAPTCALLQIRVGTYYVVKRFQNVMELHIEP
jgi:nitroimidazol reductase NimA-like FMN-containing flavoprotein (pyridoxamine 5'-phosphate oxidase superfamily)